MSYTPINWQNGDVITAAKMNKMDNGWSVESSSTTYFDGSVTTTASGSDFFADVSLTGELSQTVGSTATILFNGTSYNCTCFDDGGYPTYGGAYQDFSNYPFNLSYSESAWSIYTESAGTYTVKIETITENVTVSSDFAKARGWNLTETRTTLCEESVTTVSGNMGYNAALAYSTPLSADTLTVTFNGTEYTCSKMTTGSAIGYGGFTAQGTDFSEYPFALVVMNGANYVYTESAGTYTLKVEGESTTVETSSGFQSAVNSAMETSLMPFLCVTDTTTRAEMGAAYDTGKLLYFKPYVSGTAYCFITGFDTESVYFIPETSGVTAGFDNGVFVVYTS